MATTAVLADEPERARALAADAEHTARGIPHAGTFWALQAVTRAQAAAGQWDSAEQTARDIAEPDDQTRALAAVAVAMGAAGHWDRAERTVRQITDENPLARVEALGRLAQALARTDRAWATALAADARRIAHGIADGHERTRAAGAVVEALAATGQWDDAEEVAQHKTNPDGRREALTAVARR